MSPHVKLYAVWCALIMLVVWFGALWLITSCAPDIDKELGAREYHCTADITTPDGKTRQVPATLSESGDGIDLSVDGVKCRPGETVSVKVKIHSCVVKKGKI